MDKTDKINEAILDYYKLKKRYEENIQKIKKQIMNKPISKKEKRKQFLDFKPTCINCKNPGGMTFTTTYSTQYSSRQLIAKCNASTPCNLNIDLLVGSYTQLGDTVRELKTDLDNSKKEVVKTKNEQLFGLKNVDYTLNKFDKLKDTIKESTDLYINYLDEFNEKTNNKQQNEDLERNKEILYDLINNIKFLLKEYNNTNNPQFIIDLINLYKTQLIPINKKIINLAFSVNNITYNKDDNIYTLNQQKETIKELEINLGENKIISFRGRILN